MTPYCLRRFTPEYRFDQTRRWRFDYALLAFDNLGQCGIMAGARDERSAFYFGAIGSNNSISCEQSAPYHVDQLHSALATDDAPHGMERFVMPGGKGSGKGWSAGLVFAEPNRICEHCGKPFHAPPSQIKRGQHKFCSRSCFGKAKTGSNNHNWKEKALRTCQHCGKQFSVNAGRAENGGGKYCSKQCVLSSKVAKPRIRVGRATGERNGFYNGGPLIKNCIICGKEFKVCRSVSAKGLGKYCSQKCCGIARAQMNREGSYTRSHGGKREDLGNKYFRSGWEANYARYLNWLVAQGGIQGWEYEPETFVFESVKRGHRSYTPDFKITENDGAIVYHEIKGWMDDASRVKLDRMRKYYPDVQVIVIDNPAYYAIARQVRNLVPGWERNGKHAG